MYYRYHIFFCINKRPAGKPCCEDHDASAAFDYVKGRVKELGLSGPGGVRVNKAGCLDRCEAGPVAVVYPEGVWYSYSTQDDLDAIIDQHLSGGQVVERLKL